MGLTFAQEVAAWIEAREIMPADSSVLVAFSGGPDSCALLDVLHSLAPERRWRLSALHLDHGLREASGQEAAQAIALAEQIGVPAVVERLSLEKGGNVQERAREARLAVLEERARERGCSHVALGHTADDQAETVLMRIVRGTGPTGIRGMAPRRGVFVRPLLAQRRREILAHLEARGIAYLRDPSNRDRRFLRARARDEWVPLLERANPQLVESIARLAEHARQERAALDGVVEWWLGEHWLPGRDHELGRVDLRGLPGGRQLLPNLLRGAYARVMGSTRRLEGAHADELKAVYAKGGSRGIDLPGVRVELRYEQLVLLPEQRDEQCLRALQIEGPGRYQLSSGAWVEVEKRESSGDLDELPCDRLRGPLLLRGPLPGDRICIDAQQSRRVARILIDEKVEQAARARRPMVVHDGEPLLIIGLRRAAGWRPPEGVAVLKFTISS